MNATEQNATAPTPEYTNDLLNDAIRFTVDAHAGQLRKGTTLPYIVHPLEALTILGAMNAPTAVMIAGVLHDTVEDTGTSPAQIEERFGSYVAELICALSEDKSLTWDERKAHTIEGLPCEPYDVRCVALADKLSNMRAIARDYARIGDEVWKRFKAPKEKQRWYYAGLIEALADMADDADTAPAYQELRERFAEVFGG